MAKWSLIFTNRGCHVKATSNIPCQMEAGSVLLQPLPLTCQPHRCVCLSSLHIPPGASLFTGGRIGTESSLLGLSTIPRTHAQTPQKEAVWVDYVWGWVSCNLVKSFVSAPLFSLFPVDSFPNFLFGLAMLKEQSLCLD